MKKKGTKLVEALREDYRKLYVKEYTTGWKEQRLIRNIELGIMSLENTERYIFQELDKAREEGYQDCMDDIWEEAKGLRSWAEHDGSVSSADIEAGLQEAYLNIENKLNKFEYRK